MPSYTGLTRELGTAEDFGLNPLGVGEGVVGDHAARPAADLLGPEGPFVQPVALAPLLRAVCVIDGHANYRDRGVDPRQRPHPGYAPPGPHDDPPVDLLAKDRVGAAHVARPFRRDRRRLQAESGLTQCFGGVDDDLVSGLPSPLEREVEVAPLHLKPEHIGLEQAEGLVEQLLAGLVAVQHNHG